MRSLALLALAVVLAGCAPGEPDKQAEAIGSAAAEAALLARETADGSLTAPFAREHAKALRRNLEKVAAVVAEPRLARLATEVSDGLERLAAKPGDEAQAKTIARRLDRVASEAEELAG